ncbi:MAG: helix-turn-helix domain-containing protein [Rhizonema sp. PD38]|nr:helix-turn-helix domain-containing protein [Rhizonema sp. PD38]
MKAYSLDLRQKIVDAYACDDISQRKLAKNFGITLSFVQKLLKRHREFGTISPKVRTEQTPTKLNAEQLERKEPTRRSTARCDIKRIAGTTLRENRGVNWGGHGESDGSSETSPQPQKKVSTPRKKALMKSN